MGQLVKGLNILYMHGLESYFDALVSCLTEVILNKFNYSKQDFKFKFMDEK